MSSQMIDMSSFGDILIIYSFKVIAMLLNIYLDYISQSGSISVFNLVWNTYDL